ncbi:MAG: SDR family oxidoreductase [Cyanosarcina radialis HA8281-LM2]|jgi:uncharacterized protein YbjT (DUF2867 family)|nr:SDR family oxidoreductase [Cyanosarcina radialis HA8281-LM2]
MILVTGATGRVGSQLVELLWQNNIQVRLLVRTPEAASLSLLGISVIVGDLDRPQDLDVALCGCNRLISIPPNTLSQAEQEIRLFEAAKRAGVDRIVKLSTAKANRSSACHFFQQHAIAEDYLQQLGTPFTILRSNSFMQNFLWFAREIKTRGTLSLPMKDAKTAPVDIRDLARVAHRVLTTGDRDSKTYNVTGSEMLSLSAIAEKLSAYAKKITYIDVAPDDFKQTLLQSGLPQWYAEAIVASWQIASEGQPLVTDTVFETTGRRAIKFDRFVRDYQQKLS